jgi:histidinol-phosphate/aromatic aminotransferase/cobyric acid decarboxylase-like protein
MTGRVRDLPALPDFAQFNALRPQLLAHPRRPLDLAETRFARAVAPALEGTGVLQVPDRGHRCHVAEAWLACFALPAEWKRRALVTQGVRQALQCLFAHWAREGRRLLLPGDVYPVYLELARAAGCRFATYASWPQANFDGLEQADVVLAASPMKPRGDELAAEEKQRLRAWLQGDPRRRLAIDAVYTFDTRFSPSTRVLMESGQVLLLHSLSKGWAAPLAAGVALVPEADVAALTPAFRALAPDASQLAFAQALLEQDRMGPELLRRHLAQLQSQLAAALAAHMLPDAVRTQSTQPGQYLFVLEQDWRLLLQSHRVLALPLSVFGSTREGVSVVSSLPPLPRQ